MLKSILVALTAMLMSLVPTTAAKPPLQVAEKGIRVDPIRMAKLKMVDGRPTLDGGWVGCSPFSNRDNEDCLWECYGRAWGPGSSCDPLPGCNLNGRYYFGPGYENPYTEDDMDDALFGGLTTVNHGWFWEGDGPYLAMFFWNDQSDVNSCTSSGDFGDHGGVVLDFGILHPSAPDYYYSCADVSPLKIFFTGNSNRSHVIIHAEAFDTTTGQITLASGPVQSMLWGAPNNTGTGYVPPAGAVGSQFENAFDDDTPTDGVLDINECYTYAFGACPDPLGKMVAYGGNGCDSFVSCPSPGGIPFKQTYYLCGDANNVPWSWELRFPGNGRVSGTVAGVASGSASAVAIAFSNSIFNTLGPSGCGLAYMASVSSGLPTTCGPSWAALTIRIDPAQGGPFSMYVGPDWCPAFLVPETTDPANPQWVSFNPLITQVHLLERDCNGNGLDDAIDLLNATSFDSNGNGILDECECPSDFNGDGFVNGDDFDGYVAVFELGDVAADFNHDGFVTGDDFDSFVAAFEVGC